MNSFQLAKTELAKVVAARAKILVKLKGKQEELGLLKADVVNTDASNLCVNRYNTCKAKVGALLDVVKDYEAVRLPHAEAKVKHEQGVISAEIHKHLTEKKMTEVPVIQEKFNEAFELMDKYQDEVVTYVKVNGNCLSVNRILRRIDISDMDKNTKKRLM